MLSADLPDGFGYSHNNNTLWKSWEIKITVTITSICLRDWCWFLLNSLFIYHVFFQSYEQSNNFFFIWSAQLREIKVAKFCSYLLYVCFSFKYLENSIVYKCGDITIDKTWYSKLALNQSV